MATKRKPGPKCKRVVRNGRPWYCCCGKKSDGEPGMTYCSCAPMVGKNRVSLRGEVRYRVDKNGKIRRGWGKKRKARR